MDLREHGFQHGSDTDPDKGPGQEFTSAPNTGVWGEIRRENPESFFAKDRRDGTNSGQESAAKTAFQRNMTVDAASMILRSVGENPGREGLLRTPERFAKAYEALCQGYNISPQCV